MTRKTPAQMEEAALSKASRALIRLKYSLQADLEINEVLNDRLDELNAARMNGEAFELDLAQLVAETDR